MFAKEERTKGSYRDKILKTKYMLKTSEALVGKNYYYIETNKKNGTLVLRK